uniref:Uncharacterized protein n=1 Tax=Arundo donax TaxID=35708 RepID=A0A0A9AK60_ARUDO
MCTSNNRGNNTCPVVHKLERHKKKRYWHKAKTKFYLQNKP